jgi:hypothetical protein
MWLQCGSRGWSTQAAEKGGLFGSRSGGARNTNGDEQERKISEARSSGRGLELASER